MLSRCELPHQVPEVMVRSARQVSGPAPRDRAPAAGSARARLGEGDEPPLLLVPKDQADRAEAFTERHPTAAGEFRHGTEHFRQPVIGNSAGEMARRASQNIRLLGSGYEDELGGV